MYQHEPKNSKLVEGMRMLSEVKYSIKDMGPGISLLEDAITTDSNLLVNTTMRCTILSQIGYYHGTSHNYEMAEKWLSLIKDTPKGKNWLLYLGLVPTMLPLTIEHEKNTIERLINHMNRMLQMPVTELPMSIFIDSFWYGYYKTNPRSLVEIFAQVQAKHFPQLSNRPYVLRPSISNKIRVGVLSPSLTPNIDIGHQLIHCSSISDSFYPTFKQFDSDIFEIVYIHFGKHAHMYGGNDNNNYYLPINHSSTCKDIREAQNSVINLNLDILLFLEFHMQPMLNFLALSRMAPIQICTHGHPITTGITDDIMDYYISWDAAEIDGAQEHYTEQLELISPDVVWEYYEYRNKITDTEKISLLTNESWEHYTRENIDFVPNLRHDANWYFCPQACFKFHVEFDCMLGEILNRDSDAIIILIENKAQNFTLDDRHINRMRSLNIDISRIRFINKLPHHKLMGLYYNCNVVLDSYFFGGDTTTREAFEVGAPIVTLPAEYLGGRWTQAYYKFLEFEDLIAKDSEDYINLSIKVATNRVYEQHIRRHIISNIDKLFRRHESIIVWQDKLKELYDRSNKMNNREKTVPQLEYDIKKTEFNKPMGGTQLMANRLANLNIPGLSNYNIINKVADYKSDSHNILWCEDNPSDQLYHGLVVDNYVKIVFASDYQYSEFNKVFDLPPSKCVVIKNSIESFPIRLKNTDLPQKNFRLIYHTTPHRGLNILYQVYSKLIPAFKANGYNLHLDVYSSFNIYARPDLNQHFESLYDNLRKHENITYHSSVSNEEVREAVKQADIFVYPSTFPETSCMCLMEAMSAGCVCVHSSLAALPETAAGLTEMYEYTPNAFDHCTRFAEKLLYVVRNFSQINTMPQQNYANHHYSLERSKRDWTRLATSFVSEITI